MATTGTRDDGGKVLGIAVVDAEGGGGEILVSRSLDAENTVPEFDDIEIDFEYAFLAPKQFDEHGEVRLKELAGVGASRRTEDVLGGLLRDRTAPGNNAPHSFVAIESIDHVIIGETAVFVEMGVLGFNYRTDQIGRDSLDGNPLVLKVETLVAVEGFDLPDKHQRGIAHRNKAIDHHYRNARCEEDSYARSAELNEALCHGRQSMCRSGPNTLRKKRKRHAWSGLRWNEKAAALRHGNACP